jgi:hypothetical protein
MSSTLSLHCEGFNKKAYIGLFSNVANAEELLLRIQQAAKAEGPAGDKERTLINYAFIDAELVCPPYRWPLSRISGI